MNHCRDISLNLDRLLAKHNNLCNLLVMNHLINHVNQNETRFICAMYSKVNETAPNPQAMNDGDLGIIQCLRRA